MSVYHVHTAFVTGCLIVPKALHSISQPICAPCSPLIQAKIAVPHATKHMYWASRHSQFSSTSSSDSFMFFRSKLKTCVFPAPYPPWHSASDWWALWEALYKFIDAIQYNCSGFQDQFRFDHTFPTGYKIWIQFHLKQAFVYYENSSL